MITTPKIGEQLFFYDVGLYIHLYLIIIIWYDVADGLAEVSIWSHQPKLITFCNFDNNHAPFWLLFSIGKRNNKNIAVRSQKEVPAHIITFKQILLLTWQNNICLTCRYIVISLWKKSILLSLLLLKRIIVLFCFHIRKRRRRKRERIQY